MDRSLCLVLAVIAAVLVFGRLAGRPPAGEPYGNVLGGAAKFRGQYAKCVRKCERSDPRQRFSQNAWACGMVCDRLVSQALADDFAKRPSAAGRALGAIKTIEDKCEARCAGARNDMGCRAACVCELNVLEYCAEECGYSDDPDCVAQCALVHGARCASGNSWLRR